MRHRNIPVGVESLEPLTLLSAVPASPVLPSVHQTFEVWKRELRWENSPQDAATPRGTHAEVSHGSSRTAAGVGGAAPSGARAGAIAGEAVAASRRVDGGHGFIGGAAGVRRLRPYAPTEIASLAQLNQPLGQARADRIARALGLDKNLTFTPAQFLAFVTGNGANGSGNLQSAALVDESVAILTNSRANPLIRDVDGVPTRIVLGSYGLTVSTTGMLESPANSDAPTRQVNSVIAPGGYLSTWAAANGAEASLQMLYRSAYSVQLPHAIAAQHEGGDAELALYLNGRRSAVTGLSMVSSIWEVNFALIYVLRPELAAMMPAHWVPIPANVVAALLSSPTGQVPFGDVSSYFVAAR